MRFSLLDEEFTSTGTAGTSTSKVQLIRYYYEYGTGDYGYSLYHVILLVVRCTYSSRVQVLGYLEVLVRSSLYLYSEYRTL
jgi:hypothetical protein